MGQYYCSCSTVITLNYGFECKFLFEYSLVPVLAFVDNFKTRLGKVVGGEGGVSSKLLASQHHVLQGKLLTIMAEMFATPEDGNYI